MSQGFVLLPGAGMSDWLWSKVIPLLGAPAVAVRQRLAQDSSSQRAGAPFSAVVDPVVETVTATGWDRVVLVGHSGAGLIAAAAAPRCPPVHHLVFVAANLPAQGETALAAFSPEVQARQIEAVRSRCLAPPTPMRAVEAYVRGQLANLCTEDDLRFILDQEFRSEPLCLVTEPMDWSAFPPVGRTYVVCGYDQTLSVDQQLSQASHLGITDLRSIPSGHLPMISHPEALASVLNSVL